MYEAISKISEDEIRVYRAVDMISKFRSLYESDKQKDAMKVALELDQRLYEMDIDTLEKPKQK